MPRSAKEKTLISTQETALKNAIAKGDHTDIKTILEQEIFLSITLENPKAVLNEALNKALPLELMKLLLNHPQIAQQVNHNDPRLIKLINTPRPAASAASSTNVMRAEKPRSHLPVIKPAFTIELTLERSLESDDHNKTLPRLLLNPKDLFYNNNSRAPEYHYKTDLLGGTSVNVYQFQATSYTPAKSIQKFRAIRIVDVYFFDTQTAATDIQEVIEKSIEHINTVNKTKNKSDDIAQCVFVGELTQEQQQQITLAIKGSLETNKEAHYHLQFSPTLDQAIEVTRNYLRDLLYQRTQQIPNAPPLYDPTKLREPDMLLLDFKTIESSSKFKKLRDGKKHELSNIKLYNTLIAQATLLLPTLNMDQPDHSKLFRLFLTSVEKLLQFYSLNRSELGSSIEGDSYKKCHQLMSSILNLLTVLTPKIAHADISEEFIHSFADVIFALYKNQNLTANDLENFSILLTQLDTKLSQEQTITGYLQEAVTQDQHPLNKMFRTFCESHIKFEEDQQELYRGLTNQNLRSPSPATDSQIIHGFFASAAATAAKAQHKYENQQEVAVTDEEYKIALQYGETLGGYRSPKH